MNRAEVMLLLAEIQENYPNFDISDESIDRHYKYLHDFSYVEALKNVEHHIMTSDYPPKISHIRGHLADVQQSEVSKREAEHYDNQLQKWALSSTPPQEGYWGQLKAKLRGDQVE